MKHENPTVNHVPRDPLWDIFMPSANASVLHIVAPPTIVFTAQHPANASVLHIIAPPSIIFVAQRLANASALYIIAPPAHTSEHIEHERRM